MKIKVTEIREVVCDINAKDYTEAEKAVVKAINDGEIKPHVVSYSSQVF